MDSTEEPQKKVFKARKTMRVSDRQQLEAVYKVKEELLKTTEVKLVNGKHENGDSDMNSLLSNTDCAEDKKEMNGLVDLCVNSEEGRTGCDEINESKSPESRAENNDTESKPPVLSSENVTPEQAKDNDVAVEREAENGVGSSKDNVHEENNRNDNLDQRKNDIPSEDESKSVCDINDSSEEKVETNDLPVNSTSFGEGKRTEEVTVEEVVGEATISSSMEADQEKQEGSAGLSETTVSKTADEPGESILDNTECMETDDIIPILEKLAPAEDDLSCFSKSSLLPVDDTVPDLEDKIDNCLGSPSKQESNENLPKEAFLVLSDEEEPCDEKEEHVEVVLPNKSSLPEEVEGESKKECEDEEGEEPHKEEEKQIEKSEASKRKRSKSEDMDNVHSKHRRYMAEDYEAELQVKITARKDVDLKLQKIIQRLLEEKLNALQCAVFDKTLADLKTRMEKVECNKRHKTVLTEMQTKIARLTKRVGAAKEDLKKRQENVANAPVSPGKAAPDTANVNNATYRNAGTVRQMLESKRNVGESTPATFQAPVNPVPAPSLAAPPAVVSGQPKLQTPVSSSSSLTTAVLPTANTATVVGTNQVPTGSTQSVSVSLQSLPVILHVPVAVSSQTQLLQGHTGTLVSNQQSGNVEFISVQSSSTVGSLTKTTVSLASTNATKPNNIPHVPSPGIQRNSTASAGSVGTTLAVQAVPTTHPVAQTTRTSLPTVGTPGLYNATASRPPLQMKFPLTTFNSTAPAEPPTVPPPKIENQTSRPPTDTSANKRPAEGTTQSGKFTGSESGGVIDLTLDEEDDSSSQDGKKQKQNQSQAPVTGLSIPTQPLTRPLQPLPPLQPSPVQQPGVPTSGPSQTTIHVLPTASTTVNVTHRPVTPAVPKLPIPRTPASHQVVCTTIPAAPAQNPVRGAVMTSPGLRPVTPQTGGVTVRMPQTTYVVNNGLALGSGAPQLTVHHRPPPAHTDPPRPVHPAPLPEAPQPPRLPPEAANTSPPQKPQLKLARVQSQNGIVLSWSVMEVDRSCATVDSYHLYAYHEDPSATVASQWKKIGEVKALPLPMACTLTQFVSGSKYYFAVRAKDVYGRFGPFCDPQSTDVISSQSS
ncbi:activating transcription factor 7-interacting protein 1 isoform X3 [Oenanthe melanoleuca]|uniref:activating transcription factor 7-interacting protein 1 isoform X3 n=1 Tax=Oenanthe melanoleuca TaxID=2939378 RepID=UPI0024C17D24|nr:activating transcription factor 7-interacting protein 1 isoform X3 [Oenanthe melanoleuca]XP_056338405.1 activating transcription factor 7-interacting protein 1 isoform X3 [Oenanthe melanoleuca]XP_056338406.1 activating transcription factor 7-interacting protein 1 isoform X3 [Oenanthe melanoleuca]XP_056338407.1 activating transcription factor 7-interacting protein 1 isoform X3 [Oenanthe melanoleuca]XP_056338408.1 activating transcription factor 7-interacting protein 1 isoform X3 [Oenanthe mel